MIDITGLDKAEVLAGLYNRSKPQGMGFMHYKPEPMATNEARELLAKNDYFDYLKGRIMKIRLKESEDSFEERLYDRDNGQGAAAGVIAILRQGKGHVNAPEIREAHQASKLEAAAHIKANINQESKMEVGKDGVPVYTLGVADVADELGPAVDKALE